jgi:hypothetical protein
MKSPEAKHPPSSSWIVTVPLPVVFVSFNSRNGEGVPFEPWMTKTFDPEKPAAGLNFRLE